MKLPRLLSALCALLLLVDVPAQSQKTAPPGAAPRATPVQRPPVTRPAPGVQAPPPIRNVAPPALWGWADLHCHPASHLAFGAKPDGSDGMFWGKPGLALATSNVNADLPPCSPDTHGGFDADPVRHQTHATIIQQLDGLTGFTHGSNGAPGYQNWPSAESIIHQQMHITAMRRAYDGGLRLMIASVADNQMLSDLWSKIGFNLFGNDVPKVDPNFDYESAKRQIGFIRNLAAANSSWMEVVESAAQARQAIAANKLAIILSLEMDSLTSGQMLNLVQHYGVRHIIPIHLVNNSFGGTAVYVDLFNASNKYLNGSFYRITPDTDLTFRLSRPSVLAKGPVGAIIPQPVSDAEFNALGYNTGPGGQRNVLGLNQSELLKLMKAGVLLDVAHMSQNSTEQALRLAEQHGYPLMDSHTGLRQPGEKGFSERDLMRSHAERLARLGGVIGLGTEGGAKERQMLDEKGSPLVYFKGGNVQDWTRPLPAVSGPDGTRLLYTMRATFTTDDDNLDGGGNNADVLIGLRNGQKLAFRNINKGQEWANGTVHEVDFPLPRGTRRNEVATFTVETNMQGGLFGKNWKVKEIQVVGRDIEQDTVGQFVSDYRDALGVMKGSGGIGLGTDMNGFAPQIPFAAEDASYPITVAEHVGTPPQGYHPPSLARCQLGSRTYDFQHDGLAHYGMLPDFIATMERVPNSQQTLQTLFRSANDVVVMWEKTEAAARKL